MLQVVVPFLLVLSSLGFPAWLFWRVQAVSHFPWRRAVWIVVSGACLALLSSFVERWALGAAGLSPEQEVRSPLGLALATILFFAPLEEALKVAAVWPHYLRRRLSSGQLGSTHAVLAAGGFAAAEVIFGFATQSGLSWLDALRWTISLPAHFFFAGLWGYMLGGGKRDRWFSVIWITCVISHGIYDHLVFGRGAALLVIVLPMLLFMVLGVLGLLRETRSPSSTGRRTAYSLFEAPSIGSVREVMDRKGRPLMIHWILAGALVTLGVMFAFLAVAVYLGHRWGIDFALVDESGVEGVAPLSLLGSSLLLAFPFSAYWIARASESSTVLEPAWATGAALVLILALFSVTEPTALFVVLGIAPVGFALACVGAWLGLRRE